LDFKNRPVARCFIFGVKPIKNAYSPNAHFDHIPFMEAPNGKEEPALVVGALFLEVTVRKRLDNKLRLSKSFGLQKEKSE
jgi:hypothetical protein